MGYDMEQDWKAKNDAGTLQRHAEIVADKPRHQRALKHMEKTNKLQQQAIGNSKAHLGKKVKNGLKQAFPPDKSPFQKAGGNGGTPYDEAK